MEPQAENSSAPFFVGHTADSFLTNFNNELENKNNATNHIDFSSLNAQSKILVDTVKKMDGQRKEENTSLSFNPTEAINLKSKPLLWCTRCQTSVPQCDANFRMTPNVPSCFITISTGKNIDYIYNIRLYISNLVCDEN